VDRRPRYGAAKEWFVANALYRLILIAPLPAAQALVRDLLADMERVFARIAFAAVADRPEVLLAGDEVLEASADWDDQGSTRHEFRRALLVLWMAAGDTGRGALLGYAELASEVDEILQRLTREGIDRDPEDLRRRWRSRLLFKVRGQLSSEWLERYGPLQPIEDDRIPEPTAEWLGTTSPIGEEELAKMAPGAILQALRDWRQSSERTFESASSEGLGRAAASVMLGRVADFAPLGGELGGLPAVLVAQITSAVDRGFRDGQLADREMAIKLMLGLAEVFVARSDGTTWAREARRSIAGFIANAASEEWLDQSDAQRAFAVTRALLSDVDPTPESEERDVQNGYDAATLALNSVRGEATTAAIELLLEARKLGWERLRESVSEALRDTARTDPARSVRAALGLRLPWILARDPDHHGEWLVLLFGDTVADVAKQATWQAYLLYSRFFSDTAALLARQYDAAVAALEPRPHDERGRPRDEDERLGIHVAMAHLLALPVEDAGQWLRGFYARSAGWLRGRVTRWVAAQAASDDVGDEVRARARAFLAERVQSGDAEADREELEAISWVSGASDREGEVLRTILLPALEKTRGETENQTGAGRLAARMATADPPSAARVLQLLVAGDPWRSLPHVASAELRDALGQLTRGTDDEARAVAEDVINTLGAQGFLEFRDLLNRQEPGSA
jgi:hypothetical protein